MNNVTQIVPSLPLISSLQNDDDCTRMRWTMAALAAAGVDEDGATTEQGYGDGGAWWTRAAAVDATWRA